MDCGDDCLLTKALFDCALAPDGLAAKAGPFGRRGESEGAVNYGWRLLRRTERSSGLLGVRVETLYPGIGKCNVIAIRHHD